jgi:hypothetical protein
MQNRDEEIVREESTEALADLGTLLGAVHAVAATMPRGETLAKQLMAAVPLVAQVGLAVGVRREEMAKAMGRRQAAADRLMASMMFEIMEVGMGSAGAES